jgi:hypothetical protein
MSFWDLLLLILVGWTVLGSIGVAISLFLGERAKALRHLGWIFGIWAGYLAVLMGASLMQPLKIVAMGQDQCFGDVCFAVTGVEEVPRYLVQDGSRLVRVSVRVSNRISNRGRGKIQSDGLVRAFLLDSRGRQWEESTGISSVPLTTRVPAGSSVMSEPVFKVAKDASGLALVLTHGRWQRGALIIGGPESLLHRRTIVPLDR